MFRVFCTSTKVLNALLMLNSTPTKKFSESLNYKQMQLKFSVFVFANLKPSQIFYKIVPLSRSSFVNHVYILRKTPLKMNEDKITCLSLPWLLRQRPIYWFLTSFYGLFLMKRYQTNLILSYNIFPHGFNAYLASKISKQRAIFSEINEDTKHYFQKAIPRYLINKILMNASIICTPGKNTSSFWNKVGFSNTLQLHSTIDTSHFKPNQVIEKTYDFIYIGVLNKNKRCDLIIDAFYEIHNKVEVATLCIIGYGEAENELKKQIKKLNLEESISFVNSNNVLEYLQKSKIFVMASLSEGLPCAMMEAMSCELIVVVPSVGDISDVVEHGVNGFLYNNTKEALILYLEQALINYNILDSMKINARKTILNEHSYQVATSKWNNLLKDIYF